MIVKYQTYFAAVAHHIAGTIFTPAGKDLSDEEKIKLVELSVEYYKLYQGISESNGNLYNTDELAPLHR